VNRQKKHAGFLKEKTQMPRRVARRMDNLNCQAVQADTLSSF